MGSFNEKVIAFLIIIVILIMSFIIVSVLNWWSKISNSSTIRESKISKDNSAKETLSTSIKKTPPTIVKEKPTNRSKELNRKFKKSPPSKSITKKHKCIACLKEFSSNYNLNSHVIRCEVYKELSKSASKFSNQCKCGESFQSLEGLISHKKKCKLRCIACLKTFSSELMLKVHHNNCEKIKSLNQVKGSHVCRCGANYNSKRSLSNHQRFCVVHNNNSNKSTNITSKAKPSRNNSIKVSSHQKKKTVVKKPVSSLEEIQYVNYYTNKVHQSIISYPVIKVPKYKSIIRSFRYSGKSRKGYTEEDFLERVQRYFNKYFNVYDDVRLAIGEGVRPYEPDIAIVSKALNSNIHIDIEIDEPYTGYKRIPIHCYPDDLERDRFFTSRGWIVIRFSELQVFKEPFSCLKTIALIIKQLDNNYVVPKRLLNYSDLDNEKCWNKSQALIWEQEKYRESYLNHEFSRLEEPTLSRPLKLSKQEQIEEDRVEQLEQLEFQKKKRERERILNEKAREKQRLLRQQSRRVSPPKKKVVKKKPVVNQKIKEKNKIKEIIKNASGTNASFQIEYRNRDYEFSKRSISKIEITTDFIGHGYSFGEHFTATCSKRGEETPFKIERIYSIIQL